MRTRKEVRQEIAENEAKIKALQAAIVQLKIEDLQICDEKYWYKEDEETFQVKEGRKKVPKTFMIGRVYWDEFFQDESRPKGEGITITRSRIVREDGVWLL